MTTSVCTREAMLTLLRQNRPAAVISLEEEDSITAIVRVDPDSLRPVEGLAIVERESDAGKLLDAAFHADIGRDQATWERLPLRYGPFYAMWVLPEEPYAPSSPGNG